MLNILFIGDIVGRPGRNFVIQNLAKWREEMKLDIVIANGENAAGGSGINTGIARQLKEAGVDAITLGDHVWDQRGFDLEIGALEHVSRPANLPAVNPGRRYLIVEKNGFRLGIVTFLGRQWLGLKSECPFQMVDGILAELKDQTDAVFVEIHAEATSEKIAFGWYLDGRALAVIGTHTHVPTADAEILPRGTAYQTDAGMTGPYQSVLGRDIQAVVGRFLDGMPRRFTVAEKDVRMCGTFIRYDEAKKICTEVRQVTIKETDDFASGV